MAGEADKKRRGTVNTAQHQHICHTFSPVYDENSKILILGSFPSVKSREQGFYYGHPQNRFWKVLAAVLDVPVPVTIEEKKEMLLLYHVAVWDVIESCDIIGSSDASIRNVVPADIGALSERTKIQTIYTNGRKSESLYRKHIYPKIKIPAVALPSTSPANAAFSLEKLIKVWGEEIKKYL